MPVVQRIDWAQRHGVTCAGDGRGGGLAPPGVNAMLDCLLGSDVAGQFSAEVSRLCSAYTLAPEAASASKYPYPNAMLLRTLVTDRRMPAACRLALIVIAQSFEGAPLDWYLEKRTNRMKDESGLDHDDESKLDAEPSDDLNGTYQAPVSPLLGDGEPAAEQGPRTEAEARYVLNTAEGGTNASTGEEAATAESDDDESSAQRTPELPRAVARSRLQRVIASWWPDDFGPGTSGQQTAGNPCPDGFRPVSAWAAEAAIELCLQAMKKVAKGVVVDATGKKPLAAQALPNKRRVIRLGALKPKVETFQNNAAKLPLPLYSPWALTCPVRYADSAPPAICSSEEVDEVPAMHTHLVHYRSRGWYTTSLQASMAPDSMTAVVNAVNRLQAVGWRVNTDVLCFARELAVHTPAKKDEVLATWRHKEFKRLNFTPKRRPELPGEVLETSMVKRLLDTLVPAADGAPPRIFYLTWFADRRGRLYPYMPWLSPVGDDLQRALLEFAGGASLTEEGATALKQYGGGLVRPTREFFEGVYPAADGVPDRAVSTLEERVKWVERMNEKLLHWANDPISTFGEWAPRTGSVFQFYAFLRAYRAWKEDSAITLHLPVQIDATCNGLQHISALCGDERLAEAVNVLPRPGSFDATGRPTVEPADIYSELAEAVAKDIEAGPQAKLLWVRAKLLLAGPQRRDFAKGVVMTVPYGATRDSQAAATTKRLEELAAVKTFAKYDIASDLMKEVLLGCDTAAAKKALDASTSGDKYIEELRQLKISFSEVSNSVRPKIAPIDSAGGIEAHVKELENWISQAKAFLGRLSRDKQSNLPSWSTVTGRQQAARVLCYFETGVSGSGFENDGLPLLKSRIKGLAKSLAYTIVGGLRRKLHRDYRCTEELPRWLHRCCAAFEAAGAPVAWISETGFPVVLAKFDNRSSFAYGCSIEPANGAGTDRGVTKTLRVFFSRYPERVIDGAAMQRALMPDLIHSLDSAHLALTLSSLDATAGPIGAIHDCLLCHACDVSTVRAALQQCFKFLYCRGSNHPTNRQWERLAEAFSPLQPAMKAAGTRNPALNGFHGHVAKGPSVREWWWTSPPWAAPIIKMDEQEWHARLAVESPYFFN